MSKPRRRIPKYRHYKPKDLAVVRIDGRDHYLGKYNSPESREKYHRLIAEWLGRSPALPSGFDPDGSVVRLTINEMILAYWRFAKTYYVKDGQPTKELACMREALLPLRELYGNTPAHEFGPRSLKAVRQHMVDAGLSRGVVNHRVSRIKRVFKWAVAEEIIPPSVHHGLQTVTDLRYGRTEARETEPVKRSKSQAGLADYEVRNWRGWHHHQVLSLLATWFLVCESHRGKKIHAGDDRSSNPRRLGDAPAKGISVRHAHHDRQEQNTSTHPKRTRPLLPLQRT